MKALKFISKLLLFTIIGLLLAAFIIPVVFKDDIVTAVKNAVNDNINAEVDFADVNLSLISDFPRGSITIDSLSIRGIDEFAGIPLMNAVKAKAEVSLSTLFDKSQPIQMLGFELDRPFINILVDKSGNPNYLITKPSESTTEGDFILKLDQYKISDGSIIYQDQSTNQKAELTRINHSGSGDFFNQTFDLKTKTRIGDIEFTNAGSRYLHNAKANADITLAVDLDKGLYTLKNNEITVNELDVNVDGSVQLRESDIVFDLLFATPNENVKGLLSIVPGLYSKKFAEVKTSGRSSFAGSVKGILNGNTSNYPAIDIKANISDGLFQYPNLPKDVSNINFNLAVLTGQGDYKDLVINVPSLNFDLGENNIAGSFLTKDIETDPYVKGALKGKFVLADWKEAIPTEDIEQLFGTIKTDVKFEGKSSDIEAQNFNALNFEGEITGDDIIYKTKGQPQLKINDLTSTISPKQIKLSSSDITAGKSDAAGQIMIDSPLAYFIGEGETKTSAKINSKLIDADEWMTPASSDAEPKTVIPEAMSNVDVDLRAETMKVNGYNIKSLTVKGKHESNSMVIEQFSGKIKDSDFALSGNVDNTLGYFNNNETLTGDLNLVSDNLVMEDFMVADSEKTTANEVVLVPDNLDITINSKVQKATYDKVRLDNLNGIIIVSDRQAVIDDASAKGLGGLLKFSGLYGTPEGEKPDFAFKYDLSNLDFEKTAASIDMAQSLVPIMKFIKGQFNSTMVMEGKLGDNMFPDLATLDASGFLETISGKLQKIDIANKLADKLGIDELRKLDFDHTKNWFEIIDGMVELKPFTETIAGIDMSIAGKHGLGKSMNYQIIMDVPREMLKRNVITSTAEAGLGLLESQAAKLGVNIDQGDFIKLKVDLTGSLASPSFKITPLGSGGQSTVKDVVNDQINDIKETVTDSVKTVIDDTKQTVKDTINATVETVKDSISTVIEETTETVKDSVKSVVTDVVNEQVDKILQDSTIKEQIGDVINDQMGDIINEQTGKSVDDIKDKIKDWNPFRKKKDDN